MDNRIKKVSCYICKKEFVGLTKKQAQRYLNLHIVSHKEILEKLNLDVSVKNA